MGKTEADCQEYCCQQEALNPSMGSIVCEGENAEPVESKDEERRCHAAPEDSFSHVAQGKTKRLFDGKEDTEGSHWKHEA